MIKKLKANNFQSWKELSIKFHVGVNTIIGKSDEGKSAIFRLLYWPLFNRPLGDAFRSWWGGDTDSSIRLDNVKVLRSKTNKKNIYHINTFEDDFKAFGSSVPEEISKELRMDREINVQAQTDPIFLLSKSPGEVAQHFNKVADLEKIDSTLKKAKSDISSTKTKASNLKADIEEANEELKQYEKLEEFNTLLIKSTKNNDDITESKENVTNIQNLCGQIGDSLGLIEKLRAKYTLLPLVEDTIVKQEAIVDNTIKAQNLENKINEIKRTKKALKKCKKKYKLKDPIDNCLKMGKGITKLKKDAKKIQTYLNTIEEIKYKITKLKDNYDILNIKFKEEMPDTCPLCGK